MVFHALSCQQAPARYNVYNEKTVTAEPAISLRQGASRMSEPSEHAASTGAVSLAGSAWRLVAIGPREAPHPPLAASKITLTFTADRVGGSASCNTYSGDYTLEAGKLAIRGPISTRMLCPAPEGLMEQEYRYLQALSTAQACKLEGGVLELLSDGGQSVCRFEADAGQQQGDGAQM